MLSETTTETFKSFLVISIMIWIVYRLFTLTKRIVKGWRNGNDI